MTDTSNYFKKMYTFTQWLINVLFNYNIRREIEKCMCFSRQIYSR